MMVGWVDIDILNRAMKDSVLVETETCVSASDWRHELSEIAGQWKKLSGQEKSKCKDPQAEMYLAYFRNREKVSVAGSK